MTWESRFPFSNFQECEITYKGITYPTVENFYQALKFEDEYIRKKISTLHPGAAKKYARKITPRSDWEEIKDRVMFHGLRRKFAPGSDYADQLINTPDELLVEENMWHDNYWGSCLCSKCGNTGKNRLGEMLRFLKAGLSHSERISHA
jgi:ribA/ribD-fused uncharacterized protein